MSIEVFRLATAFLDDINEYMYLNMLTAEYHSRPRCSYAALRSSDFNTGDSWRFFMPLLY